MTSGLGLSSTLGRRGGVDYVQVGGEGGMGAFLGSKQPICL